MKDKTFLMIPGPTPVPERILLEIARANGKMASGWFWASEEYSWLFSYDMSSSGNVSYNGKYQTNGQVLCVGE